MLRTRKQQIQTNIDKYRQIQTNTDKYRQIQTNTDRYRQIQTNTNKYRQILTNTDKYKQIQTNTDKYKQIQTNTNTDKYRQIQTNTEPQPKITSPLNNKNGEGGHWLNKFPVSANGLIQHWLQVVNSIQFNSIIYFGIKFHRTWYDIYTYLHIKTWKVWSIVVYEWLD